MKLTIQQCAKLERAARAFKQLAMLCEVSSQVPSISEEIHGQMHTLYVQGSEQISSIFEQPPKLEGQEQK